MYKLTTPNLLLFSYPRLWTCVHRNIQANTYTQVHTRVLNNERSQTQTTIATTRVPLTTMEHKIAAVISEEICILHKLQYVSSALQLLSSIFVVRTTFRFVFFFFFCHIFLHCYTIYWAAYQMISGVFNGAYMDGKIAVP